VEPTLNRFIQIMSSTPLTSALPYYDREIEDQSLKSRVEAEINAEKVKMEKQEGLKDTLEQMVKDGRVVDEFHLFKVSYQITRIRRRFSATKMKVN